MVNICKIHSLKELKINRIFTLLLILLITVNSSGCIEETGDKTGLNNSSNGIDLEDINQTNQTDLRDNQNLEISLEKPPFIEEGNES